MEWHENDSVAALRATYRAEVATVLGVHSRSVQRRVAWYRHSGLAAVRAHRQGGYVQALG